MENKTFLIDNNGILYWDKKINKNDYIKTLESKYCRFYNLLSTNEYIIKYNLQPLYNDDIIGMKDMLSYFNEVRSSIPSIDFPIDYYLEDNLLRGLIIYYYNNAISLKSLFGNYFINDLYKYYSHDDNPYKNLILLYLEIISLIEELLDKKIFYLDIHSGNFILYNNQVKLIDFEPRQLVFHKNNNVLYEKIIYTLKLLINYSNYKLGLFEYIEGNIDNITKLKNEVKRLEKRLK